MHTGGLDSRLRCVAGNWGFAEAVSGKLAVLLVKLLVIKAGLGFRI